MSDTLPLSFTRGQSATHVLTRRARNEPVAMMTDAGAGHLTVRRADIQGMRAVAVVLVVAFHAGLPMPGGFVGVDMFFVISGFVITGMLSRQLDHEPRLRFGSFYARRARRLLPALALTTVFVAVSSAFLLSPFGPQEATAKTGIAASLFNANIHLTRAGGGGYFGIGAEANALLHTWSLSVEEQFYLLFPAFLLGASHLTAGRASSERAKRVTVAILVLLATVTSFVLSFRASVYSDADLIVDLGFYSPVTRAWEFGVGALLALGASRLSLIGRRMATPIGVVGLALIGFGAFKITGTSAFPGGVALIPVVGTALLLVAGASSNRGVSRLLGSSPLVWVGNVSYGWYLWHWPLIVFSAALWPGQDWAPPAAALVSVVPTWLSYRHVENPIRLNERLSGRRIIPMVALCIGLPIVACIGLLVVGRAQVAADVFKEFSAATLVHEGQPGCPNGVLQMEDTCGWRVEQSLGTVVLIGDSNAGHFTEPVRRAGNDLGYDVLAASNGLCPFIDLTRETSTRGLLDGDGCYRFVTDALDAMQDSPPELVIISATPAYVNDGQELTDPLSGTTGTTTEAKAALWEEGLYSVLNQLEDSGIPTLVVHAVPHLSDDREDWQAGLCPAIRIYTKSCGFSTDRGSAELRQQATREAEIRAVARVPGSASVDFTDELCTDESCDAYREGMWFYRDATHLSVRGALTLTDEFRQLIATHADCPAANSPATALGSC